MNFLYWLYLWQNKEYRWDRMKLYFSELSAQEFLREWVVGKLRRPQITLKIILVFLTLLVLIWIYFLVAAKLGSDLISAAMMLFIFLPILTALSVGILSIPSRIITAILALFAKRKIASLKNLLVIGVTGSYGKTSTKDAIAAVLSEKFRVLKTPGGVNTKIGIARQILFELNQAHQVYVVEMGAYKKGEIVDLVSLARPKIGVLTGINEQHLGLFGDLENTKAAKFELINGLPSSGIALLNTADLNVAVEKTKVKIKLLEYESRAPEQNIHAAIKLAEYLGLSPEKIKKGIEKYTPPAHRLEVKKGINGITILDDSYASNPAGFKVALQKLATLPVKRRILVTTGIYELGRESGHMNREISGQAEKVCDKVIVVDPPNFPYFPRTSLIEDPERLYSIITQEPAVETAVLLEGRHRVINQLLVKLISN